MAFPDLAVCRLSLIICVCHHHQHHLLMITAMVTIIIIIISKEVAGWCTRSQPLTMYARSPVSTRLSTNRVKQGGLGGGHFHVFNKIHKYKQTNTQIPRHSMYARSILIYIRQSCEMSNLLHGP